MKIIVVLLGRIGDMILATPMFSEIKKGYPDCELHVLAGRNNFNVLTNNPNVNKILVYHKSLFSLIKTYFELKNQKYDFLIDPKDHFSSESKLISFLSKAKTTIGFNQIGTKSFDVSISTQEENSQLHYVQRCIKALEYLKINLHEQITRPELFLSPISEEYVDNELSGISDYLLINVSASSDYRMWVIDKWIEFIKIISEFEEKIIMLYQSSNKDLVYHIIEHSSKVIGVQSDNIQDAFSIVRRAKLLVTPDTSLVHIASAFNIPVLGLYICNEANFNKFYPLSDISEVVKSPDEVVGIKSISVNQLYEGYLRIIEKIRPE
jgi:heptosyltransferase-2